MRFQFKKLTASVLDSLSISDVMVRQHIKRHAVHIRAVNYHGTTAADAAQFEQQLQFFSEHFVPVGQQDLLALRNGSWQADRPGLVISFDDGLLSNYQVAAPLLEKYGFVGWFFVPAAFPGSATECQLELAKSQRVELGSRIDQVSREEEHARRNDGRLFMNWDEVRALAQKHVVGSHTTNHVRLRSGLSTEQLQCEIVDSKRKMEAELGHEVGSFSWVGGQEGDYSRSAAQMIHDAGYRLSFMTKSAPISASDNLLQLHRTHVEAHWSLAMVRFQLSGIVDFVNRHRRHKTNELTLV